MKFSFSLLILAFFAILAIASAQKLCTTQEGVLYEGHKLKEIDVMKENCAESSCKYECRNNEKCVKWSLIVYGRFGGSKMCYLHGSGAKLVKKEARYTSYYAGKCK